MTSIAPPRTIPSGPKNFEKPNKLIPNNSNGQETTEKITQDSSYGMKRSNSFTDLTSSSLSGVFGSSTSLAELVGDDISTPLDSCSSQDSNSNEANATESKYQNNKHTRSSSISKPNAKHHSSIFSNIFSHLLIFLPLSSIDPDGSIVRRSLSSVISRYSIIFFTGIVYGIFAKNLHDNKQLSSHVFDVEMPLALFIVIWGLHGIVLSTLLPTYDNFHPKGSIKPAAFSTTKIYKNHTLTLASIFGKMLQDDEDFMFGLSSRPSSIDSTIAATISEEEKLQKQDKGGSDWASIIRAGSAFVGLAYGVQKISWDSSSQVAFLWACLNPILWYILDGTFNGLLVSSISAIVETVGFAIFVPSHFPPAAFESSIVYFSILTWICSVFFCCSICFGNLGRRLLTN